MKQERPPLTSKIVLKLSLALLLAVRCKQEDACLQILRLMYHSMDGEQCQKTMNRLIYLMEPTERDWLSRLA